MDIKNTVITAQMVIHSLVSLLENENVDISSVKFKVGSDSAGYESPEFELEKLIDLAIGGLGEIKEAQAVPEGFVLVPKEPSETMIMNGLLVISTEIGKYDIQKEVRMIWEKMIEAQEQGHD